MNNAKHTPPIHTTPAWIHSENHPTDIIDINGDFIARCLRSENAEFIVRAVNSHEELLAALKLATDLRENHLVDFKKYGLTCDADILNRYKKAIAKAEEKL